ncbi:MAG: hypothetical protein WC341_17280 [Bacteroidales bacterium]|jgi:hypothetical protein
MQFYEYHTVYEIAKRFNLVKDVDFRDFYIDRIADAEGQHLLVAGNQFRAEANWVGARKPYYNVWPSIIPPLLKLNLAIDASMMVTPMNELCIRLPMEKNALKFIFQGQQHEIRCILMNKVKVAGLPGVGMWIDIGEEMGFANSELKQPIYTYQAFPCKQGISLEQLIINLPKKEFADVGIVIPMETILDCVKLCCCLCLLEKDPEVVTADVLSKDRVKFDETGDQKFVEKAHRRGKVGWDIGKKIEVSPHVRIAHTALYWTGPGRTIPRILFRKGSIVHRRVIEQIPTGYMDEDQNGRDIGRKNN